MLLIEYGDSMPQRRRSRKLVKVSVNLPQDLLEDIDDLVDEVETDRTDIILGLLEYGLDHVDDVFEPEEEEETEEKDETEEESTEETK